MLLILAMGSDFRCSVGTVKSVGLEDHNKKGRAAQKLVDGGIRTMILELLGVSEFLNKINLGETFLMSIASNMCNFKMGKK